jgi:hypothetical protein
MEDFKNILNQSNKICSSCGHAGEFYKKGKRYSSSCKSCIKDNKKKKYIESKNKFLVIEERKLKKKMVKKQNLPMQTSKINTDLDVIELQKKETAKIINGIKNVGLYESDEKISTGELFQLVYDFNEYIALLLEGYGKIKGGAFYVKNK